MPGKIITCAKCDVTDSPAEAIVNAANNHLWMGAGVAGAIKRKGGDSIEREAVELGPVSIGEPVATEAGKLRARYVIHAAVMGQDLQTDAEKIRMATINSLLRAEELGLASIAFPALGTGVGGFPLADAAKIMIGQARSFLANSLHVKKIDFILFDDAALNAFVGALAGNELNI